MKEMKSQKGFTLVELAIVMTIIGLLIGGILKGQELMENARVTSTIAQIKSYEAATTTFRDTYSALPGDMIGANTRVPNCGAECAVGNSDNIIGEAGAVGFGQALPTYASSSVDVDNDGAANEWLETVYFWTHMLKADLISGVSDPADAASPPVNLTIAWGESHPAAKIGGGFTVEHGDGTNAICEGASGNCAGGVFTNGGTPAVDIVQPPGTVLALRNSPTGELTQAPGVQPISPLRAAQIDRKMDDGQALSGYVLGYGDPANCSDDGTNYVSGYAENLQQKDCGLVFKIQG